MVAGQESSFRNRIIRCRWIFDLYAIGYDHLDSHLQLPPDDSNDPTRDATFTDPRRRSLNEWIRRRRGSVPLEVRDYLGLPPTEEECQISYEFLLRLYCTLQAIDEVSEGINYFRSTRREEDNPLRTAEAWFEMHRKLNTDFTSGRVLFRTPSVPEGDENWARRSVALGERKHPRYRGQHLARRFNNLCRVAGVTGCELDYDIIDARKDIIRRRPISHLTIGIVPLVDTLRASRSECSLVPGPLKIHILRSDQETCLYMITGDGEGISAVRADQVCGVLADRAEAAIQYLQEEEAQIAVFPELVVPDAVLRRIKSVLAGSDPSGSLQLVIAGSYGRGQGPNLCPYNEAVALNSRGEELWRQRKLHYYEMHPYEQKRYGLSSFLGGVYAREAIATHPRTLRVRDTSLGRMAVLICEDVGQPLPGFDNLTGLQINYVFTPVMAGSLEEDRSFAKQAGRLSSEAGAICVVANSGPLAKAEFRGKPAALGIVSLPMLDTKHTYVSLLRSPVPLPSPPGGSVLVFRCPTVRSIQRT